MASTMSENNSFSYFSRKSNFLINQELNAFYGYINVPNIFYGIIVGKQGNKLKSIQRDTSTIINIPRAPNKTEITVEGISYDTVKEALNRIVNIVNFHRQNAKCTHFLSIPVKNKEEIQSNFQLFKDFVLDNFVGDFGIDEELFQKAHKLHLSLPLMVLGDQKEVDDAIQLINRFKENNTDLFQRPFRVHISGLGFFGSDETKVSVLYAKIDSTLEHERLQNLANQLQNYLYDEYVITKKEYESINLHITLMNSSFLKSRNRKPFDCSKLMKMCANWDFGVFDIEEMELSVMGSSTDTRYYVNAGSFHF